MFAFESVFVAGAFTSMALLSMVPALAEPVPGDAVPAKEEAANVPTKEEGAEVPAKAAGPVYAPGKALGPWTWVDEAGAHVRLTVKDGESVSHFTGTVCGKGIATVAPIALEEGVVVALDEKTHCATFDFKTDAGEDGFDLTFAPKLSKHLTHKFALEGKAMKKSTVHALAKAPVATP